MGRKAITASLLALALAILLSSIALAGSYQQTGAINQSFSYSRDYGSAMAIDPAGNLLIADAEGRCIYKLSRSGSLLDKWGPSLVGNAQLGNPQGIAVDATGNVYVTESQGQMRVLSPSGVFLRELGSPGYFMGIGGVAIGPDGNTYFALGKYKAIDVYRPNGDWVTSWVLPDYPYGVAVGKSGNVFVSTVPNEGVGHIWVFTSSGLRVADWAVDYCSTPYPAVALDLDGNILVKNGACIVVYDSSGKELRVLRDFEFSFLPTRDGPTGGVAVDSAGHVFSCGSGLLRELGPTGTLLNTWGDATKYGYSGYRNLYYPRGVACNANGIYIADPGAERYMRFSFSGRFEFQQGENPQDPIGAEDIAANSTGVYVVDDTSERYTPGFSGHQTILRYGPWGTGFPRANDTREYSAYGVGMDSAGNAFSVGRDGCVHKFNPAGALLNTWGGPGTGDGQFANPRGVAVDAQGNTYVADTGNHRIQKLSPTGEFLAKWGSLGTGPGEFNAPEKVGVDPAGNVLVADTGNHRIQCFDGSGNFLGSWGSLGPGQGQLNEPRGIAFSPTGEVLICDSMNNRISRLIPCASMAPSWSVNLGSPSRAGAASLGNRAVVGADDGSVRCVDAQTGTLLWRFDTRANGAGPTSAIQCRPAVYGPEGQERIYFTTSSGDLFCISTAGTLIWRQSAPTAPDSSPAVAGGLVYVGGREGLLAFSTADGTPAGSIALGTMVRSSPAVPGIDLVWAGGENGKLYCLSSDLSTIRASIDAGSAPVVASPLVDLASSRLYIGATDRSFRAINPVNFSASWPSPTTADSGISATAWRDSGNVYVGTNLGTLSSLSQADGSSQWSFPAQGAIKSAPVVYNHWAYFGTENGFVYAVNTANRSDFTIFSSPRASDTQSFPSSPAICNEGGANAMVIAGMDGYVYGFALK